MIDPIKKITNLKEIIVYNLNKWMNHNYNNLIDPIKKITNLKEIIVYNFKIMIMIKFNKIIYKERNLLILIINKIY